ncbi:MAG: hypothetical protein HKN44_13330 [Ilumatobacter sp.]|nr:hypothetical protein [Ilumatobacter sp.]
MTTLLAVAVLGATFGTGCTTFSDNDAVARVGDVELSSERLRDRVDARGAPQGEALDANAVREEIGAWIGEQVAVGVDPGLAAAAYAQGLFASGSICFEVIVVDSTEAAAAALDELRAGADFAAVYGERNIDPSLDGTTGRFPCVPENQLPLGTGNTFVDSLVELDDGNRLTSVQLDESGAAHAVSRFVPYDELGPDDTALVLANLNVDLDGFDIHVDPRYGTYETSVGAVVPLG